MHACQACLHTLSLCVYYDLYAPILKLNFNDCHLMPLKDCFGLTEPKIIIRVWHSVVYEQKVVAVSCYDAIRIGKKSKNLQNSRAWLQKSKQCNLTRPNPTHPFCPQ